MTHIPFQATPYWVEHLKQLYDAPTKDTDVVFLGDSITEMFPVDKLFTEFSVANRGIQGDLSLGINITMEYRVCNLNPKVLYLMIGTNDIAYWGYNNDITISYINDGLSYVRQINKGCKIVLCSIPPCYYNENNPFVHDQRVHRPKEKVIELNKRIKEYADAHDDITFFDAHALLKDENDSLPLDYTVDGLHLSFKAYEKIAEKLKPILKELLKK